MNEKQSTPAGTSPEAELKKAKTQRMYDAAIIGFLIGVAAYASFTGGFGLLTFLPLVYLPAAKKNHDKYHRLAKDHKDRKPQP